MSFANFLARTGSTPEEWASYLERPRVPHDPQAVFVADVTEWDAYLSAPNEPRQPELISADPPPTFVHRVCTFVRRLWTRKEEQ